MSILEIHGLLMQVYGNGVMTAHHVRRGCKVFRSGLTFLMMIASSANLIEDM
jgi:hypothetical protein